MGFAFFAVVVPLCCALVIATCFMNPSNPSRQACRRAALKLFVFGLVLFLSTPTSVYLAAMIDETYQASIDATAAQGSALSETADDASQEVEEAAAEKDDKAASNPLEFLQQVGGGVASTVSSTVKNVTDAVAGALDMAVNMAGNLIELFGVMLTTTILIPLISPLVMYLAFKALFGQQIAVAPQQVILLPSQTEPALAKANDQSDEGEPRAE